MTHKKNIKFGMKNVEKQKLHGAKKSIYTNDVNIGDILVSNKYQIRKKNFKYFVVDVNYSNDAIGPLLIKLPKQNVSIKGFEKECHIGLIKKHKTILYQMFRNVG